MHLPFGTVLSLACANRCAVLQAEDEYMISDYDLFVNKYISVPKDMGALNCAAFVAGIVKGVLDGAGFRARYEATPLHKCTHLSCLSCSAPAGLKSTLMYFCILSSSCHIVAGSQLTLCL